MNRQEIGLRKELAIMHLRVARAELALARASKPNALTEIAPLLGGLSTFLETRRLGKWGRYFRYALYAARVAVSLRRTL